MNKEQTELIFILDKSGSMAGLETDTIGGFNALVKKQAAEPGEAWITTVLFNHQQELLHGRIPVKAVLPMTVLDYEVGGSTALLDAIGSTIQKIANVQKRTKEPHRAGKVLVVITTDGMENASCEYTYEKVKAMIAQQKNEFSWEFLFLGANIDAVAEATKFGISEEFAADYHADEKGTELNFKALNQAVNSFRQKKQLDRSWKQEIQTDFDKRKRN